MFQYTSQTNPKSPFWEENFKVGLNVATSLARIRLKSLDYCCTTLKVLAIFAFYINCILIKLHDFWRVILKQYKILNKCNFSLHWDTYLNEKFCMCTQLTACACVRAHWLKTNISIHIAIYWNSFSLCLPKNKFWLFISLCNSWCGIQTVLVLCSNSNKKLFITKKWRDVLNIKSKLATPSFTKGC